jgi:hypothetical protein
MQYRTRVLTPRPPEGVDRPEPKIHCTTCDWSGQPGDCTILLNHSLCCPRCGAVTE